MTGDRLSQAIVGRVIAHVGPCRVDGRGSASWATNEKTPNVGERGASEVVRDMVMISVGGEVTSVGLLEPGGLDRSSAHRSRQAASRPRRSR
jgi:hypothetical protein